MEFTAVTVVLLTLVVWYFGKPLKATADLMEDTLTVSAGMARKRLYLTSDQQEFRVQQDYDKLGTKITESNITYGRGSVQEMLSALDDNETTENKE